MYRRRGYKRRRTAWKRRARYQLGERVGTGTTKKNLSTNSDDSLLAIATRTVYSKPIITIGRGDQINQRQRDMINLRGIKMEWNVISLSTAYTVLNWCVIAPKVSAGSGSANPNNSLATSELWRGYQNLRAINPNAATWSGMDRVNAQINTDMFTVFKRGKIQLNPGRKTVDRYSGEISNRVTPPIDPDQEVFHTEKGACFRQKKVWLPIRRQIRFDPTIDNNCPAEQIWFMWWLDNPFQDSGGLPETAAAGLMARFIIYFKEPKN